MAERRMFAKTIIDSDAFLDMPLSTQALYFHLSMRADDEGFINNPKRIQKIVGCGDDDLKLLMAKKFVILFESGVIVIKHWRIHNYIQKDRFKATVYIDEKNMLEMKENKAYTFKKDSDTKCIQDVSDRSQICIQGVSNTYPSSIQNASVKNVDNYSEISDYNDSDQCIQDGYILETQDRLVEESIVQSSIGKEREETTQLSSFPTRYHEIIFNQWNAITYQMWFDNSVIEEKDNLLIITVKEAYKKTAIQNRYAEPLRTLLGKDISIKAEEGD
jgi:hypothetical protein